MSTGAPTTGAPITEATGGSTTAWQSTGGTASDTTVTTTADTTTTSGSTSHDMSGSTTSDTSTSESGSTGSTGDGTTGGVSLECLAYCECMSATCVDIPGYPWGDDAGCLAACASYEEPELTCWIMWCAEAMEGTLVVHLCEHAWGEFGLDEC